jgi:hypothetical protein
MHGQVKKRLTTRMDKSELTPQGYLKAEAIVTRAGIFKYRRADGSIIRELRPPEEVFKPESMATLSSLPLTNDHPPGLLDAETTQPYLAGVTGEKAQKLDDEFLGTTIIVMDKKTIDDIRNGKVELSCGYNLDLDHTPGVWNGEEYDCVQRNIVYNHLSVVAKGRAGPGCRVRLDGDAELTDEEVDVTEKEKAEKEAQERADAAIKAEQERTDAAVATAVETAKAEMQKQIDEAQAKLDSLTADHAKALKEKEKEVDTLKARVDSLEEDAKTRKDVADPKLIAEAVKERVRIEKVASQTLALSEKFDGDTTDLDLMKMVIKSQAPTSKLDGQSETYIKARFDHIAEGMDLRDASVKRANEILDQRRDGADEGSAAEARKAMIENAKLAYTKPLAAVKKGE